MAKPGRIEPALFRHPAFIELSAEARLLYIGLVLVCGSEGATALGPKALKAALFPADELRIDKLVIELDRAKLIKTTMDEDQIVILPLELERTTRTARKAPATPKAAAEQDEVAAVMDHWRATFKKPNAILDDKRRKDIRKALALAPLETLKQALTGYSHSPWHLGANDRNRPYIELGLLLRDGQHIDQGLEYFDTNRPRNAAAPGVGSGNNGKQGSSPHERWDPGLKPSGATGAGGLPGAGTPPK